MADGPGPPAPVSRRDPLIALSCLTALVVYLIHGFDGALGKDLAVYAYGGQQVAEGHLPYATIITRSGPLAQVIPAVGVLMARALGADDLLGIRVLFMVISVACVGLAYILGRDVFRSRAAGLATAASLLSYDVFTRYAAYGPREKTALVLFMLALLLAVVHQRWLTAGVFVSLGTLTWQPFFLQAFAGVLVAILIGLPRGRLRALGRVAVGGLVPAALVIAPYLAAGKLHLFLEGFLLINLQYTRQPSLLDSPTFGWAPMESGFGASIWGFLVGMVAMLIVAGMALRGVRSGHDRRKTALIAAGTMLVVGLAWLLKAFNSWPDVFVLFPMTALGLGGVVQWLADHVNPRAATAAALAWVLVATGLATWYAVASRDDSYPESRANYTAVLDLLPHDATILAIEAPQVPFYARRRNLSRYQLLGQGLRDRLEATWPGGGDGFARWIVRRRPSLIVLGDVPDGRWLRRPLAGAYQQVGRTPGRIWLVPRSMARHRRHAIRQEIRGRFGSPD